MFIPKYKVYMQEIVQQHLQIFLWPKKKWYESYCFSLQFRSVAFLILVSITCLVKVTPRGKDVFGVCANSNDPAQTVKQHSLKMVLIIFNIP